MDIRSQPGSRVFWWGGAGPCQVAGVQAIFACPEEVAHHTLKIPGVHCSRDFAVGSYSDELDLETGTTKDCAYKNYLDRPRP